MPDQEARLLITAEDGTAAALRSVQTNFVRTQAELQRGIKTLDDGTKVSFDHIKKYAEQTGLPFKELMKHIEGNAKMAARAGTNLEAMGQGIAAAGEGAGRFSRALGGANVALATMAARTLTVGAALEVARRGFLGFADFDLQLRHVQNQTGLTAREVAGLGDEMKRLAYITGDSKDTMLQAFEELREAANWTPEQTRKLLPDLVLAAQGMKTSAPTAGRIVGDIIRNMKVPEDQAKHIFEALSHASKEYNLNIEKMGGGMSKLSEAAAAAGYTGVDGMQRMITITGIVKEALGDAGEAAGVSARMFEKMKSPSLGKALGFASGERYSKWLEQQEDQVMAVINLIQQSNNQYEIMQQFGVREAGAWRKLRDSLGEYGKKLEGVKNAQGAVQRGMNISESPAQAVKRLTGSINDLIESLGHLLHVVGVTKALEDFARIISDITGFVTALVEGLEYILTFGKKGKLPFGSMGEASYKLQAPRDKTGKLLMEYDEYMAGGDPKKRAQEYWDKERAEAATRREQQTKGDEAARLKRAQELAQKYPGGVPADQLKERTTTGKTYVPITPPSATEPLVKKMSLAFENTTKSVVAFNNAVAAAAGPSSGLSHVVAGPPGAVYGTGADARILKASYTPSGQAFTGTGRAGAAGPGGTGTSYGPSSTLAMPYQGSPGGAPSLPEPVGPGAPPQRSIRRGGGGGAPQGPGAPGDLGGRIATAKAAMEDQLRKEGVPEANIKEAANLLAGQALSESGLDPTTSHDKGTGRGIYGARHKRWSDMEKWMSEHGYDRDSLEGQARYMAHEAMTKKEYGPSRNALMGATPQNRQAGVDTLIKNFERPQDQGPGQLARRMTETERAAGVTAGGPGEPTPPPSPGGTQTAAAPSSGPEKGQDPSRIPYYYGGTLTMDGKTYRYGTGGSARGSTPAGSYNVNIAKQYGGQGQLGDWGSGADPYDPSGGPRSVATVGGLGGTYRDPRYGDARAGVQIHAAASNNLDKLYTAGCFGIAKAQWPAFKRHLLDLNKRTPGGLRIDVDKQGRAQIVARDSPVVVAGQPVTKEGQVAAESKQATPGGDVQETPRDELPASGSGAGGGFTAAEAEARVKQINRRRGAGQTAAATTVAPQSDVSVNLKVNDADVQFARGSMRRQADREVREARWNSYSDIGAA